MLARAIRSADVARTAHNAARDDNFAGSVRASRSAHVLRTSATRPASEPRCADCAPQKSCQTNSAGRTGHAGESDERRLSRPGRPGDVRWLLPRNRNEDRFRHQALARVTRPRHEDQRQGINGRIHDHARDCHSRDECVQLNGPRRQTVDPEVAFAVGVAASATPGDIDHTESSWESTGSVALTCG